MYSSCSGYGAFESSRALEHSPFINQENVAKRARLQAEEDDDRYNNPFAFNPNKYGSYRAIEGITSGSFPPPDYSHANIPSSGSVNSAFEAELRHSMQCLAHINPATQGITDPPPDTEMSMKSNERVNVGMVVRPLRLGDDDNQFAVPHFRPGEPVFIWMKHIDEQQRTNKQFPRICTVATLPQVRSFEAMPSAAADAMYQDINMKRVETEDGETTDNYVIINDAGVEDPTGTAVRPNVFARWRFFGVCAATNLNSTGFQMITVTVKGPTLMRNYWGHQLRLLTDVFFTPVTVQPVMAKRPEGTTPTILALQEAYDKKKAALTVHTVAPWPSTESLQQLSLQNQEERIRFHQLVRDPSTVAPALEPLVSNVKYRQDMINVGPYRIVLPKNKQTVSIDGGEGDLRKLVVIGKVLDIYPAGATNDVSMQQTGFYQYNDDRKDAMDPFQATMMFFGDVRINISAHAGMYVHDAYRSMWARAITRGA